MENSEKNNSPIKYWAKDDRPREKMLLHGADLLSNSELLAIIINNGNKNSSALDIAKELLRTGFDNLDELGKLSLKEMQQVKGIGIAKAITIAAVLELGRRRAAGDMFQRTRLINTKETAVYLRELLKDKPFEVFAVLFLNKANKVKNFRVISRGGITGTIADPRVILKQALDEGATTLVLTHNHPSGNLRPSRADQELTYKIKQAAAYFDIKVADHIIVSDEGYYSFADEGML